MSDAPTKAQLGVKALLDAGDELSGAALAAAMGIDKKNVAVNMQPALDLRLIHRRARYRPEAEATGDDSRMAYSVPVARKAAALVFVNTPRPRGPGKAQAIPWPKTPPPEALDTAPQASARAVKDSLTVAAEPSRLDAAALDVALQAMPSVDPPGSDPAMGWIPAAPIPPVEPAKPILQAFDEALTRAISMPLASLDANAITMSADGTLRLGGLVIKPDDTRRLAAFLDATRGVWQGLMEDPIPSPPPPPIRIVERGKPCWTFLGKEPFQLRCGGCNSLLEMSRNTPGVKLDPDSEAFSPFPARTMVTFTCPVCQHGSAAVVDLPRRDPEAG